MVEEYDFDVEIDGGVGGVGGDEDYEDLYDDVNVGFFPQESVPAAPAPALAAGGSGEFPSFSRDEQQNGAKEEEKPGIMDAGSGIPPRVDPRLENPGKESEAPLILAAPPPPAPDPVARQQQQQPPQQQPPPGDGKTGIFISDLQWWTTDADLEAALAEFGRHKGLKFSEERASGKSKGFCQVEFFDPFAAQQCKEKLNGRVFHGRPCVVQYATPQVLKQANMKNQNQAAQAQGGGGGGGYLSQGQSQPAGKKSLGANNGGGGGRGNEGGGRGGGGGNKPGSGGRGLGRGRGRGGGGNADQFGQMPMGMYDPGFVPPIRPGMFGMGYLARGPAYPMPYPPGVAPHVNPAFFGRGANGHMMGGAGGGWNNSGWEENERGGGGGYGFEEENSEFGPGGGDETGNKASREQDGEWQSSRNRGSKDGAKDMEWDRHREKDRSDGGERDRDRERERDRDRDRERDNNTTSNRDSGRDNKERGYKQPSRDKGRHGGEDYDDYSKRRRH